MPISEHRGPVGAAGLHRGGVPAAAVPFGAAQVSVALAVTLEHAFAGWGEPRSQAGNPRHLTTGDRANRTVRCWGPCPTSRSGKEPNARSDAGDPTPHHEAEKSQTRSDAGDPAPHHEAEKSQTRGPKLGSPPPHHEAEKSRARDPMLGTPPPLAPPSQIETYVRPGWQGR
jgi:hypothetical protein